MSFVICGEIGELQYSIIYTVVLVYIAELQYCTTDA